MRLCNTTLTVVLCNTCVVIINMTMTDEQFFLESKLANANFSAEVDSPTGEGLRAKTSLRMHYDAQTVVIERQLEGLEGVRSKLGLSQRKMAQLLMVDPSAWTRWSRPGHRAPGVVWRALQWYMILNEKIPGLTPNYFLNSAPSAVRAETLKDLKKESEARELLEVKLSKLYDRLSGLETQLKFWRMGTLILTSTLILSALIWVFKYL